MVTSASRIIELAQQAGIIGDDYDPDIWNGRLNEFYRLATEQLIANNTRMSIKIWDLEETLDAQKQIISKGLCTGCHIKEVEFPAKVEKVTAKLKERIKFLEERANE
jgi:Ni,Fe-hydrogenase maturation factor